MILPVCSFPTGNVIFLTMWVQHAVLSSINLGDYWVVNEKNISNNNILNELCARTFFSRVEVINAE